jgi:hypothetical protein
MRFTRQSFATERPQGLFCLVTSMELANNRVSNCRQSPPETTSTVDTRLIVFVDRPHALVVGD